MPSWCGTMSPMSKKSPYLVDDRRLGDVIAAIQVMGTYKFYKLEFAKWSERITGSEDGGTHWRTVFAEHSEFFRLDGAREKASLVMRRQHPKLYNVDTGEMISKDCFESLAAIDRERISRQPLTPDQTAALVKTAIELHSRALDHEQSRRWWVPIVSSFIGGLLGASIGAISQWFRS